MEYWYIFLIVVTLTIYSIINFRSEELRNNIQKIRKLWYSLIFLFYAIYIEFLPSGIFEGKYSYIGIPQELWILLIYFIAFMVFAVILDHLIIRTTKLGEIRFGNLVGGSINEEETRDIIYNQDNTIDITFDKIKAESKVIDNFSTFTFDLEQELIGETFSFEWYIYKPLKKYCDDQKSDIEFTIYYNLTEEELNQIKDSFNLKPSGFKLLQSGISNYHSFYCDKNANTSGNKKDILFIPYKSSYLEKTILIALQSKYDLILNDQYIICNILNFFESHLLVVKDMLDYKQKDEM